jgi:beta-N-acetylhexosaminidase
MPRLLSSVALLAVLAGACGGSGSISASLGSPSLVTTPPPSATRSPSAGPQACVDVVFNQLTLQQRVGQLFSLGLANNELGAAELRAIRVQHVGSVWFTETTTAGAQAVRAVATAVQAQATGAATGGVRFFVAANQEGGEIQALLGPGFSTMPTALAQGALASAILQRDAASWGSELSDAGVNMNFAPVMDVVPAGTEAQNAPIGMLQREFGSDPVTVASHGIAFVRGMAAAGVATTAKHFPGLGRVRGNTDDVAGVVDRVTTPNDPSLGPFRAAIAAGVPLVMVSLATYTRIDPDHLAVFSPTVMRLLRVRMGFDGVIASDDLGASVAVSNVPPAERAINFLSAGGDLIVAKTVGPMVAMTAAIVARASSDPAFGALVDAAVRHVLAAKHAAGLLSCSDNPP